MSQSGTYLKYNIYLKLQYYIYRDVYKRQILKLNVDQHRSGYIIRIIYPLDMNEPKNPRNRQSLDEFQPTVCC